VWRKNKMNVEVRNKIKGWERRNVILKGEKRRMWLRKKEIWECVKNEWGKSENWKKCVFEKMGKMKISKLG
jgi:hypothetical protein